MSKYCQNCGTENDDTATFCKGCGTGFANPQQMNNGMNMNQQMPMNNGMNMNQQMPMNNGMNMNQQMPMNNGMNMNQDNKKTYTAGLVVGILSIPCGLVLAISGWILGGIGISINSKHKNEYNTKVGYILSIIGLALSILNSILGIIFANM